jgi:aminopeptidase N
LRSAWLPSACKQPRRLASTSTPLPATCRRPWCRCDTCWLSTSTQARDGFTGRADLVIDVRQPVQAVVLHAHHLTASRADLLRDGRTRNLHVAPGPIGQSWALAPTDAMPIAPGRYTLHIEYGGTINRSGVGLYRADYVRTGKPGRTLATQLEAVHAREVFPSFDEPAFRAVFELSVRAPRGFEVVSNMPRVASRPDGVATLHRFPADAADAELSLRSVGRPLRHTRGAVQRACRCAS